MSGPTAVTSVKLGVLMSIVCVAASPPPPAFLQFTPQLPLMGFVARVQESSESKPVLVAWLHEVRWM